MTVCCTLEVGWLVRGLSSGEGSALDIRDGFHKILLFTHLAGFSYPFPQPECIGCLTSCTQIDRLPHHVDAVRARDSPMFICVGLN